MLDSLLIGENLLQNNLSRLYLRGGHLGFTKCMILKAVHKLTRLNPLQH